MARAQPLPGLPAHVAPVVCGEAMSHAAARPLEHVAADQKLAADDVQTLVIPECGHHAAEETPDQALAALTAFLAPYRDEQAAAHPGPQSAPRLAAHPEGEASPEARTSREPAPARRGSRERSFLS
jgi:hypothetical protein